ncbi:MAG: glucosaminidase domain-containing protein [Ferruginibacter sp.]
MPIMKSLCFLILCMMNGLVLLAQRDYVKRYKPLADSLAVVYKIPAKLMLGIAVIESGSGTSRNCRLLKNHFGFKGKNNLRATHGIRSAYKQYSTDRDSYIDFCKFLQKRAFYAKLAGNPNCSQWVDAISKTGYSVHPEKWKKEVIGSINKITN